MTVVVKMVIIIVLNKSRVFSEKSCLANIAAKNQNEK